MAVDLTLQCHLFRLAVIGLSEFLNCCCTSLLCKLCNVFTELSFYNLKFLVFIYRFSVNAFYFICVVACGQGLFKPLAGNNACQRCPAYSHSRNYASTLCECMFGYFRATSDEPTSPCTSKLFFIKSVTF